MKRTSVLCGCAVAAAGLGAIAGQPQAFAAPLADPIAVGPQGAFGASTYQVYEAADPFVGISWDDAKGFADGLSGPTPDGGSRICYLTTLTSATEAEVVENTRLASGLTSTQLWIGGSQQPSANPDPLIPLAQRDWFWENDEGPIPGSNDSSMDGYRNWAGTEPNDDSGPGLEEHLTTGLFGQPEWNDSRVVGPPAAVTGFIVECNGSLGEDITLFPVPDVPDPTEPAVAVVEEVINPGLIRQFACTVKEPANRRRFEQLDLIQLIRDTDTEACNALEAELRPEYAAKLRAYQRVPENPLNTTDENTKDLVLTLVKSTDFDGNPAELTRGLFLFEINTRSAGVDDGACRDTSLNTAVTARDQKTAARVNLSGTEPSADLATNSTIFCNRRRNGGRTSDQLLIDPVINIGAPRTHIAREAFSIRQALRAARPFCADTGFVDRVRADFFRAMRNAQSFSQGRQALATTQLEELSRIALDPTRIGIMDDPYEGCTDLRGTLTSRLLALTYQHFRYIRFPGLGQEAYVIPQETLDLFPAFPGDAPSGPVVQ